MLTKKKQQPNNKTLKKTSPRASIKNKIVRIEWECNEIANKKSREKTSK